MSTDSEGSWASHDTFSQSCYPDLYQGQATPGVSLSPPDLSKSLQEAEDESVELEQFLTQRQVASEDPKPSICRERAGSKASAGSEMPSFKKEIKRRAKRAR